jgi:hypothetical protein
MSMHCPMAPFSVFNMVRSVISTPFLTCLYMSLIDCTISFVSCSSGWLSRMKLRGPHPCAAIALLFVSTLANYFCQATLMIRMMSLFSSVAGKPSRILSLTVHVFPFLLSILNIPFCSALSPTCYMDVSYGTPIQQVQGMFDSKAYSKKSSSNLLLCPSHRSNGFTP